VSAVTVTTSVESRHDRITVRINYD